MPQPWNQAAVLILCKKQFEEYPKQPFAGKVFLKSRDNELVPLAGDNGLLHQEPDTIMKGGAPLHSGARVKYKLMGVHCVRYQYYARGI